MLTTLRTNRHCPREPCLRLTSARKRSRIGSGSASRAGRLRKHASANHGNGFTNWQQVGINGRAFRAVFIDAKAPDGTPKNSPIVMCGPDLQDEKSG